MGVEGRSHLSMLDSHFWRSLGSRLNSVSGEPDLTPGRRGGGLAGRLRAPGSDIPLYWDLGGRQCGAGGLGSVKVGAVAGVRGGRGAAPCC